MVVTIPSESLFNVAYRISGEGVVEKMTAPQMTFPITCGFAGFDESSDDVLLSLPRLLRGLSMTVELGAVLSGDELGPKGLVMAEAAFTSTHQLVRESVSESLQSELDGLVSTAAGGSRSQTELRIAYAQLSSWSHSLLQSAQGSISRQAATLGEE
jgi:hypothetical protein